jgi:hypothetical protein
VLSRKRSGYTLSRRHSARFAGADSIQRLEGSRFGTLALWVLNGQSGCRLRKSGEVKVEFRTELQPPRQIPESAGWERSRSCTRSRPRLGVVSLALGIGANTAIFQLIDAVRLRPLPVENPQQLAYMDFAKGSMRSGWFSTR